MSNLDTKSKYINIVIACKEFNYYDINKIELYCRQYYLHYAYIIHNKDKKIENDKLIDKNTHLHLVGILKESKRFSTILNLLRDYFNLKSLDAVYIDKCLSLEGSIQYLIHKNDSEKYQYDIKDIHHNLGSDLDTYLNMSSVELTFKKLKEIIIYSQSLLDVIEMLGIPRYNQYRHVVYDMWQYLKINKPLEVVEYERKRKN